MVEAIMPLASIMPEPQVGLAMAFALGLVYGMGPCLLACMPYLGTVYLARDFDLRRSWQVVAPLSLGRLTAYCGLGAMAGWAGQVIKDPATAASIRLLVGVAALMMGLALWWRRPSCGRDTGRPAPVRWVSRTAEPRALLPGGLYLMGMGMALTPCAPLGAVLFSAAAAGAALPGMGLGLAFGLGAIVVPSLVYGIGAAYLGARLREALGDRAGLIGRIAAAMLVLVGFSNILKWAV